MATVQIPVVVDIEGAFDEAAKRVSTAIKPLKRAIEDNTANVKLKFGEEYNSDLGQMVNKYETLDKLINSVQTNQRSGLSKMKYSVEEWATALEYAKKQLSDLNALQSTGKTVDPNRLSALRESISVLTVAIEQRRHEADLIERTTQKQIAATRAIEAGNYALIQEASTISQISDKISSLRGKLENLDPSKNKKEWTATAKEIEKATAQLRKYEQMLAASTKPGSIERMRAEMQKLEQQWNSMSKRQKFDADGNLTASAQKVINKFRELTAESEKYGQSLAQMAGRAKPSIDSTTNALRSQGVVLRNLTSIASTYVSVFGLLRLVKQIRDVTGELEYQRVSLGHLLQDLDKGNALFERIKEAAIESPFRIKDLVTYTKQLAAYRIEQEELFDTTKRLADISAGLGVDMNRLILAYGQVRAASVLRGQELRQFTEAGIPLVELLADKFTDLRGEMVTTADVFKLISERAVPFSAISDIFEDLTEKGGMFYKMQEEQAKTLKGRWEKLKDAYDVALQSVGDTDTFQRTNDIVLGALRFIADNLRIIIKLADSAVVSWAAYNAVMLIAGKRTKIVATEEQAAAIATAVRSKSISGVVVKIMGQTAAEKALTAATTQATIGTTALSRALGRLKVVLLTNPWTAAAAAILGLVLALTRYKKSADEASEATNTLNRAVDDMHTENQRHDRVSKLIEQYEKLSKVSERNVAQNESLSRTMKKLAAEFPEYSEKIKDANLPLKDRLQLVTDLNSEEAKRLKAIKDEKEATLTASETKLSYAESDAESKRQAKIDATNYYNAVQEQLEALQEKGKEGRGWLGKFLFGGNEYDRVYSILVGARQELDKTEKEFNEAEASVVSMRDGIKSLREELYGYEEETDNVVVGWKELLKTMQYSSTGSQLFTPEQLEGWTRLYDVSTDLEKEWKKLKEDVEGLKAAMPSASDPLFPDWSEDLKNAQANLEGLELIMRTFHFIWGRQQTRGASYQQDPFINMMQNRMKFMQDFKKGYDDLRKYITSSDALFEESNIMEARGLSLGIDTKQQQRAAEDLSKWYEDAINEAFEKAKAHGASGRSVEEFLRQQIPDTSNKGKALKDFQKLLQSLWDAKTDFDVSKKKKDFEDALKRLSDEIKRSETARNFYKNILDLTGDEDLAATMGISVYGDIGSEFKDRLQKQLHAALSEFDDKGDFALWDKMREALGSGDFSTILKYLDRFPEEWQKRLKEMAEADEKYNADLVQNLMKTLAKSKTYGDKQVEIAKKSAERIAEINSLSVPQPVKDDFLKQNAKKEAEETARVQYEAFKESPMYIELFENLEGASTRMLSNMRENLRSLKGEWKNLSPRELRELQNRIDELDKQLAIRNPFRSLIDSWKEYIALTKQQSRAEADETAAGLTRYANLQKDLLEIAKKNYEEVKNKKDATADEIAAAKDALEVQAEETDLAVEQAEAAQETANKYRQAAKHIQDAADGLKEWAGYVSDSLAGVGEIISTFASDDTTDTFNIISQGIGKTLSGLATTAGSVGRILAGDLTAIPALIQGVGDVIGGIFGTRKQLQIKEINKQIKYQEDLLDDLSYEYDRLEKAMAKAFGSDYIYNYNKQLENLNAQIEAYNAQADLERGKGKKADADKIREYENNARDAQDQITDMRSQLSEFFAGTDLTSAAKDFATSWIDAYKEFGNTTDAMKERFQDMIQSMIVNSLAARIVEEQLGPIFDMIDRLSQDDGILSAKDIAEIAAATDAIIPNLNSGLTGLMNSLTSLGYNIRQGVGGFTGISRDIAGASEESITGLAAGINTQNFYMSLISQNVAAILAAMTGEAVEGATGAAVPDPYKEQVLTYMGSLPQMRDDMYAIRTLLERVIKPLGTSATHYVATRM